MAHDLCNILSSVLGYAQLLLSIVDDERRVEYLAIIEAESSRCWDLIEGMLRPGELTESDAGRAANRACELLSREAALRGVKLDWAAEGGLVSAAIPQEDLERVLLTFVRNGIQAAPQGGCVDVRARSCRLENDAPGIEIEVSDTRRGVAQYSLKTRLPAEEQGC